MIIVDEQKCTGCGVCVDICPEDVYELKDGKSFVRYLDECWVCGSCAIDCPAQAIEVDLGPEHAIRFIEKVN